ncbi:MULTISPECIES: SDR family oxidoreductase [Chelativorans]|jgi:NAD(P)-dependent dehydrogenase (short-subunit alcohol dehydrogenase family)|uniref:Short-chain dehydrogenase/reductase SDR n=1 Tax=Chelativorans sp. (strain BNC1) TaxID=266779 RepID=Q11I54_CHESB|nr:MULTISPECIES: SDR family oxidoreductase [Chelativorans]
MSEQTLPKQEQEHQPGKEHQMHPRPEFTPRYRGSDRLKDKVAVITGGDSGIGRATAILFAREGAKVAFLYRDEQKDAEETERLVAAEGGDVFSMPGDVGETETAERFVKAVIERFGKIDVLVNNAAEQHYQEELTDISDEQLERTYKTNIFGMFRITRAALPHMQEGSSIICTTSVTAFKGQDVLMDYASTKGAILAFVRALSGNLASKGIRVNAVAPGPIWTPLIPASFPAEKVAKFGGNVPLGRPGQPNEVAPCMLFLACEDSSYITGQTLHPNGGTLVGG